MDGVESGPFGTSEVAAKIRADQSLKDAFVWREGLSAWEEIDRVPELMAALKSGVKSVPPPLPSAGPIAPVSSVPPQAPPDANPQKKASPETLSPMEKLVLTSKPVTSTRPPALGFSPWHAMTAAMAVGLAASFLLLKVLESNDTVDPTALAGPAVAGRRPSVLIRRTDGPLDPERIRVAIAPVLDPTRRECWQQAGGTREPNAPPHASLSVAVQVDTNGRVTTARPLAEAKGYPGLGACLANKTQAWIFPTSESTSNITLTFGFQSP
jgi:hypothetical protein